MLPSGGLLVGRHGLQSGSMTIHGTLNPLAQWLEVSFGGCVIARSLSNVSFCLCNPTKVGGICFCFFHRRLALHDGQLTEVPNFEQKHPSLEVLAAPDKATGNKETIAIMKVKLQCQSEATNKDANVHRLGLVNYESKIAMPK